MADPICALYQCIPSPCCCEKGILAGADASLFDRYPAEGTPKLTVYREAPRASYLDLPVKTMTREAPAMRYISGECRKQ
jgi:hypothetical protein